MNQEITRQIRVYGIVQGVGFRPTVSRHAMSWGVRGNVSNKGPYVDRALLFWMRFLMTGNGQV